MDGSVLFGNFSIKIQTFIDRPFQKKTKKKEVRNLVSVNAAACVLIYSTSKFSPFLSHPLYLPTEVFSSFPFSISVIVDSYSVPL